MIEYGKAAGAVIKVGDPALAAYEDPIALEQNTDYVITREFEEGAGTDDDHGAFVPANAYLLLYDPFTVPTKQLTLIDPGRPNLAGKDFVQKPLTAATAELPSVDLRFGVSDASGAETEHERICL